MSWRMNVVGVIAGVVTTLAAIWLTFFPALPHFPEALPEGMEVAGRMRYVRLISSILVALSCLLIGRPGSAAPGLDGVVGAATIATGVFVWLAGALLVSFSGNPGSTDEAYTRAETLRESIELITIVCAIFPPAVLAGYIGGKLGGRLFRSIRR